MKTCLCSFKCLYSITDLQRTASDGQLLLPMVFSIQEGLTQKPAPPSLNHFLIFRKTSPSSFSYYLLFFSVFLVAIPPFLRFLNI